MNIIKISRKLKKAVIISLDIICIFISIIFAYSLRLETFYPAYEINIYVYLIFLSAILGFNFLFGVYEVIARYFNLLNIINLFKSIISSGLILIAINLLIYQNIYFPRSVSFIAIIVIFLLMVIFRVLIIFLLNFNLNEKKKCTFIWS